MQGKKNKFYGYSQLLLLGFVFFVFSFRLSLQEGKLAFAYNTYNLGQGSGYEKLVQNLEGSQHADNQGENNNSGHPGIF